MQEKLGSFFLARSLRVALGPFRREGAGQYGETQPGRLGDLGVGTRGTLNTDIVESVKTTLVREHDLNLSGFTTNKVAV
jgi:hypothetical protein